MCKQPNCHIWYTENPHAYIEKLTPKTSHCLVQILAQRHNWPILLRKWARRGRYSQWQSLSGHMERIFVHKNWRWRYWQHLVSTGRRYVQRSPVLRPVFEDRIISRRTDVVWPPQSTIWRRWTRSKISVMLTSQRKLNL